jgi:ribonuclease-3
VLNNVIRRIRCKLYLQLRSSLSRDVQFKSMLDRLRTEGFDFVQFEKALNYRPHNWKFFFQALLHRSYLQFINGQWESNERLEFLGDAILNFIVAEYLFRTYPDMEEGNLTKLRSRLVNRRNLAQRSKDLHLSDFLLISSSAAQSIDSGSESIIADAFEAIIGALYLDGGFEAAKNFICRTLLNNPDTFNMAMMDDNYKSALLEYAQARSLGTPRYSVMREEGPEHERRFTMEVTIGTQSMGTGSGRSKKEAEQSAAENALKSIQEHDAHSNTESDYAAPAK